MQIDSLGSDVGQVGLQSGDSEEVPTQVTSILYSTLAELSLHFWGKGPPHICCPTDIDVSLPSTTLLVPLTSTTSAGERLCFQVLMSIFLLISSKSTN